mgnify:CR=1 FL=1
MGRAIFAPFGMPALEPLDCGGHLAKLLIEPANAIGNIDSDAQGIVVAADFIEGVHKRIPEKAVPPGFSVFRDCRYQSHKRYRIPVTELKRV